MSFARNVGEKFGLSARKKAESADNNLAHVTSEITAWNSLVNR